MQHKALNSRGLTLLEMTLALALFGLVIAAIWLALSKVGLNDTLNAAERGTLTTVYNVRKFYGDRPITDDSDLNNDQALRFNLIAPELMLGGTPSHPLGMNGAAPLTIKTSQGICGAGNHFFLSFNEVSPQSCNQFVARLAGSAATLNDLGIIQVNIDGVNLISAGNQLDRTTLNSECNDVGNLLICFRQ